MSVLGSAPGLDTREFLEVQSNDTARWVTVLCLVDSEALFFCKPRGIHAEPSDHGVARLIDADFLGCREQLGSGAGCQGRGHLAQGDDLIATRNTVRSEERGVGKACVRMGKTGGGR